MSETNTAGNRPGTSGLDGGEDVEVRARLMGWKPKDEYRGNPEKWSDAATFLERGFATPAVLADRYKVLSDKFGRLERDNSEIKGQLSEAVSTVQHVTTMMRSSEQRAYDRARKDLEVERERAVETGDKETFKRLDKELQELPAPPAAPVARPVAAPGGWPTAPAGNSPPGQAPQAGAAPAAPPPELTSFYERNPWYVAPGQNKPGGDPELSREADTIHIGLRNTRSDLDLAGNLQATEERLRRLFPDRAIGGQRRQPAAAPQDDRRDDSPAVLPSGNGAGRTPATNTKSFDAMPKESKEAYTRYNKMLAGKGNPLTKEEWAGNYWAQFE